MKTVQYIRLIDVFAIAPFLVYVGTDKALPAGIRYGLIGIGIATFLYNGYNYLQEAKHE